MRVAHPRVLDDDAGPPPAAVDIRGRTVPLDDDGSFETDDEAWVQQFAERYGVDPEDLTVDGLEDKTVEDLKDMAAEAGIEGRSKMNKDELIDELREE